MGTIMPTEYPTSMPSENPTSVPTSEPSENPTVIPIVDVDSIESPTSANVDDPDQADAPVKSEGIAAMGDDLGIYLWIGIGVLALVLLGIIGLITFCVLKRKKMKHAVTSMGYDDW